MLGSASPRNPSVTIAPRSSARGILLVACRSMAEPRVLRLHPSPSSSTRISFLPPNSMVTAIASRAGVERVLDQFLDDGGRALDDLAGGDLVREVQREPVDAGHTQTSVVSPSSSVTVLVRVVASQSSFIVCHIGSSGGVISRGHQASRSHGPTTRDESNPTTADSSVLSTAERGLLRPPSLLKSLSMATVTEANPQSTRTARGRRPEDAAAARSCRTGR